MTSPYFSILLTLGIISSYGQTRHEVYINYETGITLELENEGFKIIKTESWINSSIAIDKELSNGKTKLSKDTITLITNENKLMMLVRETDEILRSLSLDIVPTGQKLYVATKFYPNGKVQEQGRWEKGKKSGIWTYWGENGEMINKRIYKNGIVKKDNYKFRWER